MSMVINSACEGHVGDKLCGIFLADVESGMTCGVSFRLPFHRFIGPQVHLSCVIFHVFLSVLCKKMALAIHCTKPKKERKKMNDDA